MKPFIEGVQFLPPRGPNPPAYAWRVRNGGRCGVVLARFSTFRQAVDFVCGRSHPAS